MSKAENSAKRNVQRITSGWTHTFKLACIQTGVQMFLLRTCIHTCMHTYIHAYKHALLHASVHTYTHMYVHTCAHTCAYTSMHKCFKYMNTYICTYTLNACPVGPRANLAERERKKRLMCDEYFSNACASKHNKYF